MRESASTDLREPQGSNPLGPPGPELQGSCTESCSIATTSKASYLFLTVYSSIFLQNRGLRNHRGGVAPGAVSPPGADGSTC